MQAIRFILVDRSCLVATHEQQCGKAKAHKAIRHPDPFKGVMVVDFDPSKGEMMEREETADLETHDLLRGASSSKKLEFFQRCDIKRRMKQDSKFAMEI